MACLQPPFIEDTMPALMNSICYKQPKPITHYSASFQEIVSKCLMKKKEDRPLISDLMEYFSEKRVPFFKLQTLSPLDASNFKNYKNMNSVTF
jgi:serine/threonine protein kinase